MKMQKIIKWAGAITAVCACMCVSNTRAAMQCFDAGAVGVFSPTPGPLDIYMVDYSGPPAEPTGLNYYSNGGGYGNPGQIFTTSNNPTGYIMNYVYVLTGGSGGGGINDATGTPQSWNLNLYQIQTDSNGNYTNATFVQTFSSANFVFFPTDWLVFTNFSVALAPNTTYAYTVKNTGNGWEKMDGENVGLNGANISGVFTNGAACLIPGGGGVIAVTNNYTPGWQADFDVGLAINTTFNVYSPTIATPGNIFPIAGQMGPISAFTPGTVVTLNDATPLGGVAPYTYTWRTDGGTGGAMTPIPGDSGVGMTSITITTAGLGAFLYDVVVNDSTTYSKTTSVATVWVANPNASATVQDAGPSPLTSDCYIYNISQTTNGGQGDAMNYYDNNQWNGGAAVGQTFTTGPNPGGYTLTSLQIDTGNNPNLTSGNTLTPQTDYLYIFKINPSNTNTATILQVVTNSNASDGFAFGNWVAWNGLNVPLANNTVYAYTFQNGNNGWAGLATSPYPSGTNSYPGGVICQIDPRSGAVIYDATNTSATFVMGLSAVGQPPITCPLATPIDEEPFMANGLVGMQVDLTENPVGTVTVYQWQWDAGNGGALANIPSSNTNHLHVDTSALQPGLYKYDVIVGNGSITSTSQVVSLTVVYANTTATLTELGLGTLPYTPGPNDIYQTNIPAGSSQPPGMNYYFDNQQASGQTFTTGPNASGYTLHSVALDMAGNGGGLPSTNQAYYLRLFIVKEGATTNAVLYATYLSSPPIGITNMVDWVQWTGFAAPLQPNTKYAYTFCRESNGAGWNNMANVTGDTYLGGEVCAINAGGGPLLFSSTAGYDATFDLGITVPPPTLSIQAIGGGQVKVTWSAGSLLQAPSVTGPWTTNAATSPYTLTPTGAGTFYRASN